MLSFGYWAFGAALKVDSYFSNDYGFFVMFDGLGAQKRIQIRAFVGYLLEIVNVVKINVPSRREHDF